MKNSKWLFLAMFVLSVSLVAIPSAEADRATIDHPVRSKATNLSSSSSKKCDAECQKKLENMKKLLQGSSSKKCDAECQKKLENMKKLLQGSKR